MVSGSISRIVEGSQESTELAKETVDGHPCVKNKVTVTSDKGVKLESTVWNATDLKDFPIRMQYLEEGRTATLTFSDVKLAKQQAAKLENKADSSTKRQRSKRDNSETTSNDLLGIAGHISTSQRAETEGNRLQNG